MGKARRRKITFIESRTMEHLLFFADPVEDPVRRIAARAKRVEYTPTLQREVKWLRGKVLEQLDGAPRTSELQGPSVAQLGARLLQQLRTTPGPRIARATLDVKEFLLTLELLCECRPKQQEGTRATNEEHAAALRSDRRLFLLQAEMMRDALRAYASLDAIAGADPSAVALRSTVESALNGLVVLATTAAAHWTVLRCHDCARFYVRDTKKPHKFCGRVCRNANRKRDPTQRADEEKDRRLAQKEEAARRFEEQERALTDGRSW